MKMSGNKIVVLAAALLLGVVALTPRANSQAAPAAPSHPPPAAPMPLKAGPPPPGLPPSPPPVPAPVLMKTPVVPVAAATMDVKYDKGLLSVKAEKADLAALLKKVSEVTGIAVEVGTGVSGSVSLTFSGLKLEEAFGRILEAAGGKNLATEYAKKPGQQKGDFKIEKITVVRRGVAPVVDEKATQAALEAVRKRDEEYRVFFEEMDKKGNKIARAIREYRDPDTSARKRTKIKTYLRQSSFDDPADKKLLMAALRDPQIKGEITSDLQMALLHSVQEHPEPTDKEYILELLKDREAKLGWLYYIMLKVWDDRYVPYLIERARDGRPSAIEILGEAKVKEAVPVLEDLLENDKSETVRSVAWGALLQITGKKYKWEDRPAGQKGRGNQ